MPLNMQEIPTEAMVEELARRYYHLIVIGATEAFASPGGDTVTDLMFLNGHILVGFGLLKIVEAQLQKEWIDGCSKPMDTP